MMMNEKIKIAIRIFIKLSTFPSASLTVRIIDLPGFRVCRIARIKTYPFLLFPDAHGTVDKCRGIPFRLQDRLNIRMCDIIDFLHRLGDQFRNPQE